MKVGYIRVSTLEQNTIRQEVIMRELGVDKIFIDKASGKNTERIEFKKMMELVRMGDTLIVESYSRLARSTQDLLNIVDKLKEKGVEFVSQKENFDTSTSSGRFMLTVFAGLSQLERETMLERQREGIDEAKKAGKYTGRQPKAIDMVKFRRLYNDWKANKIKGTDIQKILDISPATFHRRVKEFERKI